ncbi:MAG: hypothetical protein HY367_03015 [Candidatus Aenigmarchaeota archaeon]|nr:hypothetical protein [Candidatus Aenigmarchaeota archaeon]
MALESYHPVSKIILILIAGVVIYMLSFPVTGLLVPRDRPFGHMMGNFGTPGNILVNSLSVAVGLVGMLVMSLLLFRKREQTPVEKPKADEFSIMKRALSADEALLLEKVRAVPDGITQDSLRFRLNWSKAKVSTMLSNLDRMGLVQRERLGKTYKVHYQSQDK